MPMKTPEQIDRELKARKPDSQQVRSVWEEGARVCARIGSHIPNPHYGRDGKLQMVRCLRCGASLDPDEYMVKRKRRGRR